MKTMKWISTGLVGLLWAMPSVIFADDDFADARKSWQGAWKTSYGTMILQIEKDGRFTGYYGSAKHALRGKLDSTNPATIRGSWKHTGSSSTGLFQFNLDEGDRKRFRGVWTSGETDPSGKTVNWTGSRNEAVSTRLREWKKGEKPKWAGMWKTTYGDLILIDEGGGRFRGSYGPLEHSVSGRVKENSRVLSGTWAHTDSDWTGRFMFELEFPDQFRGQWTSGESTPSLTQPNWTGHRSPTK